MHGGQKPLGRIIKANLSWSRTRAKFPVNCRFICESSPT